MLALCMSLVFGCCWVLHWWVLSTSSLFEGQSVPHFLSVVQVWTGCVEADSFVYNVLRLLSHSCSVVCSECFLHYLVVFPDQSWISLVWLPLLSSPSSIVICWWFLCWWVSSSSRYPGVYSFHLFLSLIHISEPTRR